jgi:hypothetical protein
MRALDAKLGDALGKVIRGEPARRIAIEAERAALQFTLLSGRQILFLIYAEFSKDDAKTDHIAYTNLERIQLAPNDAALEPFLILWDNLLLTFKTMPTEAHLYSALFGRLRKIPGLATTVDHVDRQPYGHADKSYEFIMTAARNLVEFRRTERQQNELMKTFMIGGPGREVALPGVPDGPIKKICFVMRDKGSCEKGANCPYSHDRQRIETARRQKKEEAAKGKGKGNGKAGKGKQGTKGKGKGDAVCHFFNTPKGCSRGAGCPFKHEKTTAALVVVNDTPPDPPKQGGKTE